MTQVQMKRDLLTRRKKENQCKPQSYLRFREPGEIIEDVSFFFFLATGIPHFIVPHFIVLRRYAFFTN